MASANQEHRGGETEKGVLAHGGAQGSIAFVLPARFLLIAASSALLAGCGAQGAPAPLDAPRCAIPLPAPSDHHLVVDGTRLRDALGRIVFLRGVNAGGRSKFAPFAPFDYAEGDYDAALARYLDRAAALGFSVLRVPFVWAAVEPTKGLDDEAFLARYDALLDAAWQRRMWTIVDFHQDIYSESYCGDGFPSWTIPDPVPAPHHDCADWFVRYSKDGDVRGAFDRLWADQDGTLEAFRSLWDRLAARHADRPGVIGFEPINEPHPGNADASAWAKGTLTPFYTEMAARIHQKAPDALVFFDATGTDAIGAATAMDEPEGEGLVFAPHWYDPAALFGGVPAPSNAQEGLAKWAALGAAWDLPVLVGESGAPRGLENAAEFVTALEDAMDDNGLHFTYWEYSDAKEAWNAETLSFVAPDGKEAEPIVSAIARPYARAVAGDSPAFRYDTASRVFTLSYAPTPDGVTEIVLPERSALSSFRVELSSGCVDDSHPGLLLVRSGEQASTIELAVRPR